jgi:hypothetical protein
MCRVRILPMSKQSKRERQAWTAFVEKREGEKKAKPPAELEASLDDLVEDGEATSFLKISPSSRAGK